MARGRFLMLPSTRTRGSNSQTTNPACQVRVRCFVLRHTEAGAVPFWTSLPNTKKLTGGLASTRSSPQAAMPWQERVSFSKTVLDRSRDWGSNNPVIPIKKMFPAPDYKHTLWKKMSSLLFCSLRGGSGHGQRNQFKQLQPSIHFLVQGWLVSLLRVP